MAKISTSKGYRATQPEQSSEGARFCNETAGLYWMPQQTSGLDGQKIEHPTVQTETTMVGDTGGGIVEGKKTHGTINVN